MSRNSCLFPLPRDVLKQPHFLACHRRYAEELAFEPKSQQLMTFSCWAEVTGAWTTHDVAGVAASSWLRSD